MSHADLVAVGDLRVVAAQSGAAPAELGGSCTRIGSAAVGESGEVVFTAHLAGATTSAAIVGAATGRPGRVLARAGDPAPGGGRYAAFGGLDLGEDGSLLFVATLDSGTSGVFLSTPDGTRKMLASGSRYRSFTAPSLISYPLPTGPYHRLAVTARRTDGRRSLIVRPSYDGPTEILTTGTEVAGGILTGFTASRVGLGLCCVAEVDGARVALLAGDDTLLWGDHLRDGGRVDEQTRIARLLTPPGLHVFQGLLAADLDDGASALITRPAGADPRVFARSGDPAPGLDAHIVHFGPPVASNGLPATGAPCGIAAKVRLSTGEDALWLGVFHHQTPMTGAAILPLLTGDPTDDEPPVPVTAFTPVKLTNAGALLLRATTPAGDTLLLLDHLFDWHEATDPAHSTPALPATPPDVFRTG